MISPKDHPENFLMLLGGMGAAIGLGHLLASEETLTARKVVGRAVVHAGFGATAGAASLLFPTAEPLVLYGLACALASLGNSALEMIFQKYIGKKPE